MTFLLSSLYPEVCRRIVRGAWHTVRQVLGSISWRGRGSGEEVRLWCIEGILRYSLFINNDDGAGERNHTDHEKSNRQGEDVDKKPLYFAEGLRVDSFHVAVENEMGGGWRKTSTIEQGRGEVGGENKYKEKNNARRRPDFASSIG